MKRNTDVWVLAFWGTVLAVLGYAYFALADSISINTNTSGYAVQQMPTVGGEIMNRWNRSVLTPVIAAFAVPTNGQTPQIPVPATPSGGSDFVGCCYLADPNGVKTIFLGTAPLASTTPGTAVGIPLSSVPVCLPAPSGDCTLYTVSSTVTGAGQAGVQVQEINK